jgi:hypothetical protein
MRGIRSELTLNPESLLKPLKSLIYRGHKGADFPWNLFDRKSDIGPRRTYVLGDFRRSSERPQCPTKNCNIYDEQDQQDRKRNPSYVLEEIGDDVVDQHVPICKIFPRLNTYGFISDELLDAGAGNLRIIALDLEKLHVSRFRIGGKYRHAPLERREQDVSLIVENGIRIASVSLRIEALKIRGEIERPAAIPPQDHMVCNGYRLVAHRPVVDVVGRQIQQPR